MALLLHDLRHATAATIDNAGGVCHREPDRPPAQLVRRREPARPAGDLDLHALGRLHTAYRHGPGVAADPLARLGRVLSGRQGRRDDRPADRPGLRPGHPLGARQRRAGARPHPGRARGAEPDHGHRRRGLRNFSG